MNNLKTAIVYEKQYLKFYKKKEDVDGVHIEMLQALISFCEKVNYNKILKMIRDTGAPLGLPLDLSELLAKAIVEEIGGEK